VEKIVKKFRTFAESEAADRDFYRSLTPEQRMEIFFEINSRGRGNEAEQRLERVCRVVKRGRR
jgi:uncharacterized protein YdeI (YjbR/CyaY-like superfamily)